jgi:small subunit ribosomal protein S18
VSNQYSSDEGEQDYRESSGPGGKRFYAAPRVCQFCTDHNAVIDYKQADQLRRFVSEDGKIRPRRQTGTCARHQRQMSIAIKRARHLAMLPFAGEVLR